MPLCIKTILNERFLLKPIYCLTLIMLQGWFKKVKSYSVKNYIGVIFLIITPPKDIFPQVTIVIVLYTGQRSQPLFALSLRVYIQLLTIYCRFVSHILLIIAIIFLLQKWAILC